MNHRSIRRLAVLGSLLLAPMGFAQTIPPEGTPKSSLHLAEFERSGSNPGFVAPPAKPHRLVAIMGHRSPFSKPRFVLLSAAVYAAAFADMHQTLAVKHYSWWSETDPLARPLVRLPASAYYASGIVLATGVNWLSWKMAHSRRWHKLAPIPQLLTISGNLYGFQSNRF